jgi:class 3 adenylate cyclase
MAASKPHPPTGNVTFLFTDIVGSTERWEQYGDAFLPVLQAHNAILNEAVSRSGGYVIKTEGDSFKVAFADPADAARCAVLAQAALQRYPWPQDIGGLSVRMAIHTGQPFMQANDYFGPPVNRCARILSATHGGQILVSEDALSLLHDRMDPGVRFKDQGYHRLKDLDSPIRLFQLSHPRLELLSFPPPRSLNAHSNNLPTQRRSFIGREKEIEQIASAFASGDTRLLTLTGPSGIGKTRLSIQAAAEYAHLFEGICFVRLANATDVTGAAIEVADSLGVVIPPGAPPLETVQKWLADRSYLIVLDDCGSVPQADRFVRELLSGTSSLRCLATSHQPLDVAGAAELAVPELTLPPDDSSTEELLASESGRLFVERAYEERSDFELSEPRAGLMSRILNKVGSKVGAKPADVEKVAEKLGDAKAATGRALKILADRITQNEEIGLAVAAGKEEISSLLQSIGGLGADRQKLDEAERQCRNALDMSRQKGDRLGIANALRQLGNIAFAQKAFDKAVTLLSAANQAFHELGSPEALNVRPELEAARRAQGHDAAMPQVSIDSAIETAMAP